MALKGREGAERTIEVALEGVRWQLLREGRGPVLLALHGTGSSRHSFRSLLPHLTPRFTVLAPDLPGHGGSRTDPSFTPTLPGIARALGALLAHLGDRPTAALGHSAGAAIAARMALDGSIDPALLVGVAAALVPFRGLAKAVLPVSARILAAPAAARLLATRVGRAETVARLLEGLGTELDEEGIERYRRLAASPDHLAGVLAMLAAWDLEPLFRDLPRLAPPVLLISGERDRAVPIDQQQAVLGRLRAGRLVTIPATGHLVHEERPAEVAAAIEGELTSMQEPVQGS
ncbi:MAG: alpha/beta fold hydrolase BchO [Sandaracinaceae bacterium]